MQSPVLDQLGSADLKAITTAFQLGPVSSVERVVAGLMNDNFRLATETGVFLVKRVRDVPVDKARRNLHAVAVLAAEGLPVAGPVLAGGDPVLELGSGAFTVTRWVEGVHLTGGEMSVEQARLLGTELGALHGRLRALLPDGGPLPASRTASVEAAIDEADRFLEVIASRVELDDFDLLVDKALRRRVELVEFHRGLRPETDGPVGPGGWTHGDVQPFNLLWRDGGLVAVVDWDRLGIRSYGEEVARTATLVFAAGDGGLDLAKVEAFAAGYRAAFGVVDGAALRDAVARLLWKRLCDFWHLDFHYLRADHGCDHLFVSATGLLEWWLEHEALVELAIAGPR
ncbi:hypothetical protein Lfu02_75450 [Longispora fulva]|uniref:Homoserine kinase type II n=1 Tax=Longispora fulva TaxID=619741 RepID=A0A8J7GQM1_9ACTN|nr:phosphotransferase [Longispora fulva]MBG6136318.1 homoserine kinase type II [Longispora fulva]GIG63173.1 hypothetical protein Lfu02_75450 [Longispora fulva]